MSRVEDINLSRREMSHVKHKHYPDTLLRFDENDIEVILEIPARKGTFKFYVQKYTSTVY
jgi:hypothetical protein